MIRTKSVTAGGWRTLEWFWGGQGTAFFLEPSGAQIKVFYGYGWLGKSTQKQTLDGLSYKDLRVGKASFAFARMQILVAEGAIVTYDLYPGDLSIPTPAEPF